MALVGVQHSLPELVENFAPGGCYGIEWEVSGNVLKHKAHYNPQWRVDGVAAKGLDGLYTKSSSTYEFPIGHGLVGRTLAKQKALFVKDLQVFNEESIKDSMQYGDGTEFLRVQLAKDFDIRSAIFIPLPSGVLEVGSSAVMTSMPQSFAPYVGESAAPCAAAPDVHEHIDAPMTSPPLFLQRLVEELSCAACYGIEWVPEGEVLKHRSHFDPQWREEGLRRQSLNGAYTTESAGFTFAKGEGLVGTVFAEQSVLFVMDAQTVTPEAVMSSMQTGNASGFLRAEIAKKFGIRSVLFLPLANGVLEVGSTQTFENIQRFLSENAARAVGANTQGAEVVSALQGVAR